MGTSAAGCGPVVPLQCQGMPCAGSSLLPLSALVSGTWMCTSNTPPDGRHTTLTWLSCGSLAFITRYVVALLLLVELNLNSLTSYAAMTMESNDIYVVWCCCIALTCCHCLAKLYMSATCLPACSRISSLVHLDRRW